MRNNRDYIAISVESRKGGVGKTTAALNLALYCLDQKSLSFAENDYEVLFFDMDLTGTEASKSFSSFENNYWGPGINIVKTSNQQDELIDVNLVDLFDKFMAGDLGNHLDFKWADSDSDTSLKNNPLVMEKGKINVFSSFMKSILACPPRKEQG